jgi:hypothetical protein
MRIIELSLAWPEALDAPFREDFFLGAWHPEARLEVRTSGLQHRSS